MTPTRYPFGDGDGEYALACDKNRRWRLLIIPALFDEGNKLRRFSVDLVRRFDAAGIDSFLPDLPGTNESLTALGTIAPASWHEAVGAAAAHFGATHALGIRGGALFVPTALPGWLYAPANGATLLRQLMRARMIASREAGREESQEMLFTQGREGGLELGGYALGAAMIRDFPSCVPPVSPHVATIEQDEVGGSGLWLRAEPDDDTNQADKLAALVAMGIKA